EEADLADIPDYSRMTTLTLKVVPLLLQDGPKFFTSYFAWHRTPRIEFVGESAEDHGGPQREFF
ncbi:hypothetical protein M9458_044758, partial [Cirrhinus mrigala]